MTSPDPGERADAHQAADASDHEASVLLDDAMLRRQLGIGTGLALGCTVPLALGGFGMVLVISSLPLALLLVASGIPATLLYVALRRGIRVPMLPRIGITVTASFSLQLFLWDQYRSALPWHWVGGQDLGSKAALIGMFHLPIIWLFWWLETPPAASTSK